MIAALLLAAAAPIVTPADPTAQFQGDGAPLKFDPTCRDYTLTTVSTDAACAERITRAEAGPALAIAAQTLAKEPARSAEAVALLEKALAAKDHPAIHYFLGTLYGTAERLRPDYAKARRHLTIAADRGNPAAADLLANLLIDGRGGPRDVPRAIKLYEKAAANGFPGAAITLAMLHLQGRHVQRDDARGRALIDAAVAGGFSEASRIQTLAQSIGKIHHMQLLPASDEAAVKVVRYGPFDNPIIPPAFGFDESFQQVYYAPFTNPELLAELTQTAVTRPTPYLYELARRLSDNDPDRALETYLLAAIRMTYDGLRCAEEFGFEAAGAWTQLMMPDLRFLLAGDISRFPSALRRALDAESKLPADTTPWWVCRSGMAAMAAASIGKPGPLKLKPRSEWAALRRKARTFIESSVLNAAARQ